MYYTYNNGSTTKTASTRISQHDKECRKQIKNKNNATFLDGQYLNTQYLLY